MRKKYFAAWLITCCGVAFVAGITSDAFAETFWLKNGKAIDGKVIEETEEYIKVQSGLDVMKVRKSMLDDKSRQSLNSKAAKDPAPAAGAPAAVVPVVSPAAAEQPEQVVGWTGWYMTSSYYLNQAQRNLAEMDRLAFQNTINRNKAHQEGDREKEYGIVHQSMAEVSELAKSFQAVTPPAELAQYHAKILEYQDSIRKYLRAALFWEAHGMVRNQQKANRAMVDALAELVTIYKKHGAPEDEIKKIEKTLRKYQEILSKGTTLIYEGTGQEVNFDVPALQKKGN